MHIGIRNLIFVVLGIFLIKIAFVDPMMTKQDDKQARRPASVRTR